MYTVQVKVDANGERYVTCPDCLRPIGLTRFGGQERIAKHNDDAPGVSATRCAGSLRPVVEETR